MKKVSILLVLVLLLNLIMVCICACALHEPEEKLKDVGLMMYREAPAKHRMLP